MGTQLDARIPAFGMLDASWRIALVLSTLVYYLGLMNGYIAYGAGFVVFFLILVLVLRRMSKNPIAQKG